MTTYAAIKYAIPGTAITGVLQTANNLSDVPTDATARTITSTGGTGVLEGGSLMEQSGQLSQWLYEE